MALLMQHVSKQPQPLSEHRSDLPDEFEALILSCLEKDPSNRPASAFDLEASLASIALQDQWDCQSAAAWWVDALTTDSDSDAVAALDETMQIRIDDTK